MKFLPLFLLLLMNPAFAQRKINAQTFHSSARPVLNAILSDFYQMMEQFPEFPKELTGIVDEIDDLHGEKDFIREKCPRQLEKACLPNIDKLRAKLSAIQAKALTLISHQNMSESLHMNPLGGMRTTNQFIEELEELKATLDNASLILKAGASLKRPTFQIIKRVDELSTFVSLTVVEFIPFAYKEDFRHFYFNFIHPVQQHIARDKNYEFLNRNMNSLNFALNLLNQNLTKRSKKTPPGMAPYLSVIHSRWNSLLRY